jgi:hypothetical protein
MTERGDDEGEGRGGDRLVGWLNNPDPFRDQVRHPGIKQGSRESSSLALAQVADVDRRVVAMAHEITLLSIGDFGVTAQSTASITPGAPPPFPEKSIWAR